MADHDLLFQIKEDIGNLKGRGEAIASKLEQDNQKLDKNIDGVADITRQLQIKVEKQERILKGNLEDTGLLGRMSSIEKSFIFVTKFISWAIGLFTIILAAVIVALVKGWFGLV